MTDIRLSIAVDSTGAVKSVNTFNAAVGDVPASANKASSALKSMAADFASGLGIGAGIAAFQSALSSVQAFSIGAAKAVGDYADQMVTLGQRTGLTTNSLQVFNAIAKTSGTDVGSLSAAVVRMEVAIGKGSAAFGQLGLSLTQLRASSPDEAFERVATAIGAIEDPMQRASAAVAIFGRSGAEMLPVFTSSVADARREAEALGLVLDANMLAAVENLGDRVDLTGMAFDALKMRIAGMIGQSPAVLGFVDGLGRMFGDLSKQAEGSRSALENFAKNGVWFAVDGLRLLVSVGGFAFDVFDSLVVIWKAAGLGALASARAVMELARAFAYLEMLKPEGQPANLGIIAELDFRIAAAGQIQSELRKEQELIKQNRVERGKFTDELKRGLEILRSAASVPITPGRTGGGGSFGGGSGGGSVSTSETFGGALALPFDPRQFGAPNYTVNGMTGRNMPGVTNAGQIEASAKQIRASFDASRALQDLANIASLSGSKLGKGLASVLGGGAGIASGLSALKGASALSGISGLLGKAGAYGQMAAAGIGIVSGIVGLFKKKPKPPPEPPPKKATAAEWSGFVSGQQDKGAAGVLAGVSGIKVNTAADMAAQGSIASQSFWAMFKSQGLVKAADAFKAVRDKMVETFKAAGASDSAIGALIGPMSQMVDLGGNEAFRGAADGANGFAQALASIANEQLPMSIDQFKAFEQQAVAGYEQMRQAALAQGMSAEEAMKTALQGSGQLLTTLKDASAKYGIGLGESQQLFDAAAGAGVAFAGSSEERLILSLDALTTALGGAPPAFANAMTGAGATLGANLGAGLNNAGASLSGRLGVPLEGMSEEGIGGSVADAMSAGLSKLGSQIIAAVTMIPTPVIKLDNGQIAGGVADAITRGFGGIETALAGRG